MASTPTAIEQSNKRGAPVYTEVISTDMVGRYERIERTILRRYKVSLKELMNLSISASNENTRVQAHKVLQECVIKPLKDAVRKERERRQSIQDGLPQGIMRAIIELPVMANVKQEAVSAGNTLNIHAVQNRPSAYIADDLVPGATGREAAEKALPVSIDAQHHTQTLDSRTVLCNSEQRTVQQCGAFGEFRNENAEFLKTCGNASSQERSQSMSHSGLRRATGKHSRVSRTPRTPRRRSFGPRSGSSLDGTPKEAKVCQGYTDEHGRKFTCSEGIGHMHHKRKRCHRCGRLQRIAQDRVFRGKQVEIWNEQRKAEGREPVEVRSIDDSISSST